MFRSLYFLSFVDVEWALFCHFAGEVDLYETSRLRGLLALFAKSMRLWDDERETTFTTSCDISVLGAVS